MVLCNFWIHLLIFSLSRSLSLWFQIWSLWTFINQFNEVHSGKLLNMLGHLLAAFPSLYAQSISNNIFTDQKKQMQSG